jgi:hypothetical protein
MLTPSFAVVISDKIAVMRVLQMAREFKSERVNDDMPINRRRYLY